MRYSNIKDITACIERNWGESLESIFNHNGTVPPLYSLNGVVSVRNDILSEDKFNLTFVCGSCQNEVDSRRHNVGMIFPGIDGEDVDLVFLNLFNKLQMFSPDITNDKSLIQLVYRNDSNNGKRYGFFRTCRDYIYLSLGIFHPSTYDPILNALRQVRFLVSYIPPEYDA